MTCLVGFLWLVAVVCFGPLTLTWLLGVLLVPFWVGMIGIQLARPERFADDSATIWDIALPIGLVIGGLIGLVGLTRVLTMSRRERPKSNRVFTIGMVTIGLMTLLIFHQPFVGMPDRLAVFSLGGLVHLVLPFTGAAWLLAKSWPFLFAGPGRTDVEIHGRGIEREHRDDWRLDA